MYLLWRRYDQVSSLSYAVVLLTFLPELIVAPTDHRGVNGRFTAWSDGASGMGYSSIEC